MKPVRIEDGNGRDKGRRRQDSAAAGPGCAVMARVRRSLSLLLMLSFGPAMAADGAPLAGAEGWQGVAMAKARQRDIVSSHGGHVYRIFVEAPDAPPPPGGYPVLYVLDGNAAFPVAAFLARSVARRSQATGRGAPLVVGIGYPGPEDFDMAARTRDYTLPSPTPDKIIQGESGGADRFLDFIDGEVKPLIAASYPVDPERQALFGHSFGGLLVLHALFSRPQSFSAYLASSPSLWWGQRVLLGEVPDFLQRSAGLPKGPKVQISVGELEDELDKGKHSREMLARLSQRLMVPDITALAAHLGTQPAWRDRLSFHLLAGENHGSAWFPALARGMDFFLD